MSRKKEEKPRQYTFDTSPLMRRCVNDPAARCDCRNAELIPTISPVPQEYDQLLFDIHDALQVDITVPGDMPELIPLRNRIIRERRAELKKNGGTLSDCPRPAVKRKRNL